MGVSVRHNSRLAALVAHGRGGDDRRLVLAGTADRLRRGLGLVRRHGRCRAAPAARHPRRPGAADGGRRSRRTRPPRPDLERSALAGHRQRGGHLAELVAAGRPDRRTPARGQRRGVPAGAGCVRGVRERGPRRRGGAAVAENSTEAYVVPLARTTRVEFDGLSGDLVADLDALASGRVPVLVLTKIEPEKAPEGEGQRRRPKPEKAPRRRPRRHRSRRRHRRRGRAPGEARRRPPRRRPPRPRRPEKLPSLLNLPGLLNLPRPEKLPEPAEAELSERSPRKPGRWAAMFGFGDSPAPAPAEAVEGLAPATDLDDEVEPEHVQDRPRGLEAVPRPAPRNVRPRCLS